MITSKFYIKTFLVNFILFLTNINLYSQSDVMIFPRRVVFEGNNNIQEVTLVNNGKDTAKYILLTRQILLIFIILQVNTYVFSLGLLY